MADTGSGDAPQRRYDEEEVRELFRRATEPTDGEELPARASGLTLDQLEQIAREAGIEVAALRRAARDLEARPGAVAPRSRATAVAGAPLALTFERSVPVELEPAGLEALIPALSAATGATGQASLVGRTLTWQSRSQSSPLELQVIITSRNGRTGIRIEERYGGLAGLVYGTGVGGVGAGVGFGVGVGVGAAIGSTLMAVGFPIAVLGVTYLGSRALFGSVVGRRRDTLDRLADALAGEVADAARTKEIP